MTHDEKPDRGARAVDRLLSEAGARWRASQPEPTIMEVEDLVAINIPRSRRAVLAAAATAAVVFVGLGVAYHEQRADRGPAAQPTPSATRPPLVVREGGEVSAYGYIVAPEGKDPRLCQYLVTPASGGLVCDGLSVPLDRLRLSDLPSPRVDGHARASSEAFVQGTYRSGRVRVDKVLSARPDQLDPRLTPPPPCDPPKPYGWEATPRFQQPGSRPYDPKLEAVLKTHPEVYSGVWTTIADYYYNSPITQVTVVGTTGDVDAARAELTKYVPKNLCVAQVRFSHATLDDVRASISAKLPAVDAAVDPVTDTVVVSVVAYDERTHEAISSVDPKKVQVVKFLYPLD